MNSSYNVPGYYHRNIEEYRGRNDPDTVKAVAKEMEALFVYELIKAMRQTTTAETKESLGKDTYMGMFDMELARLLAERGLGLQEMLLKTFNNGKSEPDIKNEKTSEIQTQSPEPDSRLPFIRARSRAAFISCSWGHQLSFRYAQAPDLWR